MSTKVILRLVVAGLVIGGIGFGVLWLLRHRGARPRDLNVVEWINHPQAHPDWAVQAGVACSSASTQGGRAPFLLPTSGFIGYLWDDTFDPSHRHQGIDIFGGREPGLVPVVAAADGYLTRLADWKSTVIQRLPSDPLQPGRQIWLYYTHMADANGEPLISAEFPPGTNEVFVKAGTPLGLQGNFSGTPGKPVGVHLHFSIVQDDGKGRFLNELEIGNTLDPSPYLGIPLNARANKGEIPSCLN